MYGFGGAEGRSWESPECVGMGRLPARSPLIPFPDAEAALANHRESSPWFQSLSGVTLNSLLGWERNNFDRVIHFCYGLLLAYPVREFFLRVVAVRGFWGYFLPLDLTMSTSMNTSRSTPARALIPPG